jgi:hypothetical protein
MLCLANRVSLPTSSCLKAHGRKTIPLPRRRDIVPDVNNTLAGLLLHRYEKAEWQSLRPVYYVFHVDSFSVAANLACSTHDKAQQSQPACHAWQGHSSSIYQRLLNHQSTYMHTGTGCPAFQDVLYITSETSACEPCSPSRRCLLPFPL